jgi:hypothetical protein
LERFPQKMQPDFSAPAASCGAFGERALPERLLPKPIQENSVGGPEGRVAPQNERLHLPEKGL